MLRIKAICAAVDHAGVQSSFNCILQRLLGPRLGNFYEQCRNHAEITHQVKLADTWRAERIKK
jgi:hypothetical protein